MVAILIGLASLVLTGIGLWFKYGRAKPDPIAQVNAEVATAEHRELSAVNQDHADPAPISDELRKGDF